MRLPRLPAQCKSNFKIASSRIYAPAFVAVRWDGRDLTFNDVAVRVSPDFELELLLDTDEANAAGVERDMTGEILT